MPAEPVYGIPVGFPRPISPPNGCITCVASVLGFRGNSVETELHSSDAFHCSTVLSSNCSLASMTWQSSWLLPLYCVCPPVHCCLRLHSLPCTFRAAPADPPCSQRRRALSQSAVFAPRWLGFSQCGSACACGKRLVCFASWVDLLGALCVCEPESCRVGVSPA